MGSPRISGSGKEGVWQTAGYESAANRVNLVIESMSSGTVKVQVGGLIVELRRATKEQIAGLRAAKQRRIGLPIVPGFYAGLVDEAEPFLVVEACDRHRLHAAGGARLPATGRPRASSVTPCCWAGSTRATSTPPSSSWASGQEHRDRYEDVLDLLRDTAKPTAYLVRTDDCRLNATLLARGLQVEATALVMVPEESARRPWPRRRPRRRRPEPSWPLWRRAPTCRRRG